MLQQMNRERELTQPLSARIVPIERVKKGHAHLDDLAREDLLNGQAPREVLARIEGVAVVLALGLIHGLYAKSRKVPTTL